MLTFSADWRAALVIGWGIGVFRWRWPLCETAAEMAGLSSRPQMDTARRDVSAARRDDNAVTRDKAAVRHSLVHV